jgi:hypothetical protein
MACRSEHRCSHAHALIAAAEIAIARAKSASENAIHAINSAREITNGELLAVSESMSAGAAHFGKTVPPWEE